MLRGSRVTDPASVAETNQAHTCLVQLLDRLSACGYRFVTPTVATHRRYLARAGGRMLLYTASAIVDGEDRFEAALRALLPAHGCTLRYAEIDPDIFGSRLAQPDYEDVERIAAVGAVIEKPEGSDEMIDDARFAHRGCERSAHRRT